MEIETIEGYAAIFSIKDRGGDVIEPGAFRRTMNAKGPGIPFLWQHDSSLPLGVGVEMREDDRGLWIKAQMLIGSERGKEVADLIRIGSVRGLSIGYRVVKDSVERDRRILREIELFEYSAVTFPMHPQAQITAIGGASVPAKAADMSVMRMDAAVRKLQRAAEVEPAAHTSNAELAAINGSLQRLIASMRA